MPRQTAQQRIDQAVTEAVDAERKRAGKAALRLALRNDWCSQVFAATKALKLTPYLPTYYLAENWYTGWGGDSFWSTTGECFYLKLADAKKAIDVHGGKCRVVEIAQGKRTIIHKVNY